MFKRILVAVDLEHPETWLQVAPAVASLADCFSAEVTLCTIVQDKDAVTIQWFAICYEELIFKVQLGLQQLASHAGHDKVRVEVGMGSVCSGILDVARQTSAELIVLASHRPEFGDYLLAGNAARVARRASCSVLIVRPAEALELGNDAGRRKAADRKDGLSHGPD